MKKRRCFFLILLFFFFLAVLVSCNKAESLYKRGSYTHVLEYLESKDKLTKDDYLIKIKSLNALGREEEVQDSVITYLFMAKRDDERELPVRYYVEYDMPDMLNVTVLQPTDGYDADALLFKSFYNLGLYNEAKIILSDYLSAYLTLSDYVRVLIKYQLDNGGTLNFFKAWFEILTEEEYADFAELLESFSNLPLEESLKQNTFDFIDYIKNSPYSFILN